MCQAASERQSNARINFNISFPHLHCDMASIDLWDKIGRNQADVTRNIEKWQLDEHGHRRMYQGRNRRDYDIMHDTHHPTLEDLHENGVHAEPIGECCCGVLCVPSGT